jgi:uncharacterized oligopeptide transporter (OPT) family protein
MFCILAVAMIVVVPATFVVDRIVGEAARARKPSGRRSSPENGGLIVFGASGLILGPVIFTVTRFLLQIWRGRNAAADA